MLRTIRPICYSALLTLFAAPAFAGEVGVSNKWTNGHSWGNTKVEFSEIEKHDGKEASFTYATKSYEKGTYDYDHNLPETSTVENGDNGNTYEFENVNAGSYYIGIGTYSKVSKADGTSHSNFKNNSFEHATTSFSNFQAVTQLKEVQKVITAWTSFIRICLQGP